MPIGFLLTVLFQDLCIFSGESSHLWLWFLKALGMYVTISHWFYSQFKGLKLCLIPIPSLGAMTSSPWYSEIIPSGPVFSSQTLLKKSVISFRVDGTQCALHAFSDLFSMRFFSFFFSFAIILSFYLSVQVLDMRWGLICWGPLLKCLFKLFSTLKLQLWNINYFFPSSFSIGQISWTYLLKNQTWRWMYL